MPAQEPAPEKKRLFGQSSKEPPAPSIDPNLINQINDVSRRLRIAEENYSNLRKKTQLTDQNMLKSNKRIDTEIKAINEDTKEIRKEIGDINSKIGQIAKELQIFAKKDDVKTLQKYVNLWEPIKFVTHDQVENIVRDIIEEK